MAVDRASVPWRVRGLAAFWVTAGTLHFVIPTTYEAIVPDYLPAHRALVYTSAIAEIAGGLATLDPRTRRAAGWWLVATLLGVFPANVDMALHPDRYESIPTWALYARLPLQGAAVAWALWATREPR